MGANSQKAFTTDKLKKFEVSGKNGSGGSQTGDKAAKADNFGRTAAKISDSSAPPAFAAGGAAKAPSLGRAGRAKGGRINRPAVASTPLEASKTGGNVGGKIPDNEGGKARNLSMLTDGGPRSYGDRPLIIGQGDQNALRAKGGRVGRARGGRTKGAKGKTVVNVIVGKGDQQQPPAMPPHPMMPPPPPPPPPQAASGPRPPMPGGMPMPMPMPGGGAGPPGPPGPPGMPPGMPPPGLPGRASGGRIKFGAGSGQGRMANAKRNNSGKVELAE